MAAEVIRIVGARQHNLKNLTLTIPRDKLVVMTGLSGSGKSSGFARRQVEDAISNFGRIYDMLCSNTVGTEWLTRLEKRNNLFPNMNYRIFRKKR